MGPAPCFRYQKISRVAAVSSASIASLTHSSQHLRHSLFSQWLLTAMMLRLLARWPTRRTTIARRNALTEIEDLSRSPKQLIRHRCFKRLYLLLRNSVSAIYISRVPAQISRVYFSIVHLHLCAHFSSLFPSSQKYQLDSFTSYIHRPIEHLSS